MNKDLMRESKISIAFKVLQATTYNTILLKIIQAVGSLIIVRTQDFCAR
jgi:hypothetical protein